MLMLQHILNPHTHIQQVPAAQYEDNIKRSKQQTFCWEYANYD